MHLRHLLIQNCKLMRQLELPFVHADESPRLWTVLVGENGTCKTTLLRAIAMAAAGGPFSNSLVGDSSAFMDRRLESRSAMVEASFGFSARFHAHRTYPKINQPGGAPPEVVTRVEVGATSVRARASYGRWEWRSTAIDAPNAAAAAVAAEWAWKAARAAASAAATQDPSEAARWAVEAARSAAGAEAASSVAISTPIDDARDADLAHWFVAGYGTGRVLSVPMPLTEGSVPKKDRLRSLFDPRHLPLGTRFSDALAANFGEDRARAYAKCLRSALVTRLHTPRLENIELRGKGGANNQVNLIESHRFVMKVGSEELRLPAIWLSQGYQAVISLVADIIGNVWLEAGEPVELDDMEGIVLVDELDLHLHPTWQTEIVAGLKRTFPNMQFIVTTHSPLVLAGCRADEVWMLTQDKSTGDVTAEQGRSSPMVMTGSELNRAFFGIDRASPLGESLRHYVELASDPYRSDADDQLARTLLARLHANDIPVDYQPVPRKSVS
jgi:AAA domain, putative AbiEii toxin, Type IV TA system